MQPLPMNELVKSQLEEAGFQVTLQPMDWNALLAMARGCVPPAPDVDGEQRQPRRFRTRSTGMTRFMQKAQWSPNGSNWGHFYSRRTWRP